MRGERKIHVKIKRQVMNQRDLSDNGKHTKELKAGKNARKRCNKSLAKLNRAVRRGYYCDACRCVCKMRV